MPIIQTDGSRRDEHHPSVLNLMARQEIHHGSLQTAMSSVDGD